MLKTSLRQKIEYHWRHSEYKFGMSKINSSGRNRESKFEQPPPTAEVRKMDFLLTFYYHFFYFGLYVVFM